MSDALSASWAVRAGARGPTALVDVQRGSEARWSAAMIVRAARQDRRDQRQDAWQALVASATLLGRTVGVEARLPKAVLAVQNSAVRPDGAPGLTAAVAQAGLAVPNWAVGAVDPQVARVGVAACRAALAEVAVRRLSGPPVTRARPLLRLPVQAR